MKLTFGRYKGQTIEEISLYDENYLEYLLSIKTLNKELLQHIQYVLDNGPMYLGEGLIMNSNGTVEEL